MTMKVAILFSGGKDSTLALMKVIEHPDAYEIGCLISIISENPESYMFHTPNVELTKMQAEAIGIPLIQKKTTGEKEKELTELEDAIKSAKKQYKIEGIVTGAIASVYQATRVQEICRKNQLWCINPLWQINQTELVKQVWKSGIKALITGVFAHPLDKSWLGKEINDETISELLKMQDEFRISPSGEGGEIETTVIDAPFFQKKIKIEKSSICYEGNSGVLDIKKARLVKK